MTVAKRYTRPIYLMLALALVLSLGIVALPMAGMVEALENPSEVWVDDDFNAATPGWQTTHFDKIQDGVDAVDTSGTVHVAAGTYNESVTVGRSLILLGAKSDIDPRGGAWTSDISIINAGEGNNGILITASGVTVNGFKITDSGVDAVVFKGTSAIYVYNETTELEDISIIYNWVDNNFGSGIIVRYANNPVVAQNYISNNGAGIWAAAGIGGQELINGSLSYNEVCNSVSYGIYLGGEKEGSVPRPISGTLISHNNLHNNSKYGIELYGMYDPPLPHDVRIENNDIHDNDRCGIKVTDFINTLIKDNQFTNNGGNTTKEKYKFGVLISAYYGATNTQFTGNTFSGNELGGIYFLLSLGGADLSSITVNFNNFLEGGTKSGIMNNTSFLINATNNWWGAKDGPSGVGTGSGDAVSANVEYDPWLQAELEGTQSESISGSGTMQDTPTGGDITIDATGNHTITVATYTEVPAGTSPFTNNGSYYDIHLESAVNVTSLTVQFCPALEGEIISYWDGASWVTASNQVYADGCITVTITSETMPSLEDLTGTPFGQGFMPPVGGEVYPVNSTGIVLPWVLLGMAAITGSGLLLLRRRKTQILIHH